MVIDQNYGGPQSAQFARQQASGGQTHPAFQLPAENPFAEGLIELFVEWHRRSDIQQDCDAAGWDGSFGHDPLLMGVERDSDKWYE